MMTAFLPPIRSLTFNPAPAAGPWRASQRLVVALAGTDPHRLQQVIDEDLAVPYLAGVSRLADGLDHPFHVLVGGGDLQLYLRQEVDLVLPAPGIIPVCPSGDRSP